MHWKFRSKNSSMASDMTSLLARIRKRGFLITRRFAGGVIA